MYMLRIIRTTLGANFTEPPGYPDLHSFRLVEIYMYTRAATTDMKEKVLSYITQAASKLRLVFAATAFDIQQVIQYSPPGCFEEYNLRIYVQETGRAGHSGFLRLCF